MCCCGRCRFVARRNTDAVAEARATLAKRSCAFRMADSLARWDVRKRDQPMAKRVVVPERTSDKLCDCWRVAHNHAPRWLQPVSYTHLRAHETVLDLVCRLLLEKKNTNQ